MGDPSENQQPLCPCGLRSYPPSSTSLFYSSSVSRSNPLSSVSSSGPINLGEGNCRKSPISSSKGGEMDSKHFPSRSTTDNLPSSLSTPGERAGLTSGPATPVDAQSVATSSSSTNTISSHLPSGCNSSSSTDIVTHSSATVPVDSGTEASRLPPTQTDSETSSSTCSDKSFDPKFDSSSHCSSSSCSSLASSISAAIASSSIGHNNTDECFATDFQTKSLSSNVTSSLSQTVTDSLASSKSVPGQTVNADSNKDVNNVTSSPVNITKTVDNEEQIGVPKLPNTHSTNAKSVSMSNPSGESQSLLKEKSTAVTDVSSQVSSSKGIKRTHDEMEAASGVPSPEPSPQMNKKRCFECSCKLELAQRTIGKCRCDRIFCPVHRLPELHNCKFNHKEDGRREAREKMVKPTRHMGTSFRRDDHS